MQLQQREDSFLMKWNPRQLLACSAYWAFFGPKNCKMKLLVCQLPKCYGRVGHLENVNYFYDQLCRNEFGQWSLEHIGINTEDGKWVLFVCLCVTGLVAYVRKQCQSSRKWIMFMCNRFGCVYVCVWLHKSLSSRNRRAMNSRVDETHVTSPGSKLRYSSIRWNQEDVSPSGRIFLVSVSLSQQWQAR